MSRCHHSKSNLRARKRIRRRKVILIWLHYRYAKRSVREQRDNLTLETDSRLILDILETVLPRHNASIYFILFSLNSFLSFFFLYKTYHRTVRYHIQKISHLFSYRSVNTSFNLKVLRYYKRKSRKIIKSLHGKTERFLLKYYLKIKFLKYEIQRKFIRKNGFEMSKNLAKYTSENNFVGPSK